MSNYDLICQINDARDGLWFDHIEGYTCVGDVLSDSYKHPIQYRALTNVRAGDDDPYEGIGWTPNEALESLLQTLIKD